MCSGGGIKRQTSLSTTTRTMSIRATVHRYHVNSNGIITIIIKIVLLLVKGEVVTVTIITILVPILVGYKVGKEEKYIVNDKYSYKNEYEYKNVSLSL